MRIIFSKKRYKANFHYVVDIKYNLSCPVTYWIINQLLFRILIDIVPTYSRHFELRGVVCWYDNHWFQENIFFILYTPRTPCKCNSQSELTIPKICESMHFFNCIPYNLCSVLAHMSEGWFICLMGNSVLLIIFNDFLKLSTKSYLLHMKTQKSAYTENELSW